MAADIPGERTLVEEVRKILVAHYHAKFAEWKATKGRQAGSSAWSSEAQKLVTTTFPFVRAEFVFHKRSKSSFDLYSPPHNLAIELEMFQGNAIYEFYKVLFKMLIAGPSYSRLIMVIPKEPGTRQLRSPFNRISFETFERVHDLHVLWMVLDQGPDGFVGSLTDLCGLYPSIAAE